MGGDDVPRRLPRAGASAAPRAGHARSFKLGRELWIERDDFEEVPPKGFFRLFPGNKVRLKYGYVDRVHRLRRRTRDGKRRSRCRRAGARHQERHAGRRRGQGQGHDHLGRRRPMRCRPRCGCTTACSPRRSPSRRRGLARRAQPATSLVVASAYVEPSLAGAAPASASSSSATATSCWTRKRQRRPAACSTAPRHEGQLGQVIPTPDAGRYSGFVRYTASRPTIAPAPA